MFIDTHCHVNSRYFGEDSDAAVTRARDAGVSTIVTIGCGPTVDDCRDVLAFAKARDGVFATVGIHPHEADSVDDSVLSDIATLAADSRVVAVGETGLDYHYDHSERGAQARSFRGHFEIAREVGKPLVIHNRESDEDCIAIMREERAGEVGGVVHCFTSGWELARVAVDAGFYIGFTGIVSFRSAENVRDVLRRVPLDRIVIETDSPYLAPTPYRGKKNEPAYVVHVAAAVAETLGMSVDAVAELTTANARRLYRLPA